MEYGLIVTNLLFTAVEYGLILTNLLFTAVEYGLLFACEHCKFKTVKHDMFRSHCAAQHNITLSLTKIVPRPLPQSLIDAATKETINNLSNAASNSSHKYVEESKKPRRGRPKKNVSTVYDELNEDGAVSSPSQEILDVKSVDTLSYDVEGVTIPAAVISNCEQTNETLCFPIPESNDVNSVENHFAINSSYDGDTVILENNSLLLEASNISGGIIGEVNSNNVIIDSSGLGRVILGTIGSDGVLIGTEATGQNVISSSTCNSAPDGSVVLGDIGVDENGFLTLLSNSNLSTAGASGLLSYRSVGPNVGPTSLVITPSNLQGGIVNRNLTLATAGSIPLGTQNLHTLMPLVTDVRTTPVTDVASLLNGQSLVATTVPSMLSQPSIVSHQHSTITIPLTNQNYGPTMTSFSTIRPEPRNFIVTSKTVTNDTAAIGIQVKKGQRSSTGRTRKPTLGPPSRNLNKSLTHPVIVNTSGNLHTMPPWGRRWIIGEG